VASGFSIGSPRSAPGEKFYPFAKAARVFALPR